MHALVAVNDEPASFYLLVENPEGNLYKEVWPQHVEPGPYLVHDETGPISADEVIALAGLDPGVVQETRTFDEFFERLVDDEVDGARYSALKSALWAELTDLVVVRLDEVEVQVFVVGRTACGEVAGVRTMSVET